MVDETRLINVMSESLGIKRYKDEDDGSFVLRCLYSACRFWIEAFCLDDGFGGKQGISTQLIARKLKSWLIEMSGIYPWILKWFSRERGDKTYIDVKTLYDQVIMVGDIISENQGKTYRCAYPHKVLYGDSSYALVGLWDISLPDIQQRGVLSGMMFSTHFSNESGNVLNDETYNPSWWNFPDSYRTWERLSDLSNVEYFDPYARKYKLREQSSWKPDILHHADYALARTRGIYTDDYYFVKKRRDGWYALKLTADKAMNLSLHVRKSFGKPLCATIESLDNRYVKITAPFGLLPVETARWMDYMTWPVQGLQDRVCRILHKELLESAIRMFKTCELEIREN